MLSKLRHYRAVFESRPGAELSVPDLDALHERLGPDLVDLRAVESGTLGVSYLCEYRGRPTFLKTHAVANGRAVLEREIGIFLAIYGSRVPADRVIVPERSGERLWLLMDRLHYPASELDPTCSRDIAASLHGRADEFRDVLEDDFATLIAEGEVALGALTLAGLSSERTAARVADHLRALQQAWAGLPHLLCHGDFGPKNIMSDAQGPVVIDWEDAFLGFPGYDYLYWLTFFQNRKYHSPAMFGHTLLGSRLEVAVLALVVLVKCEISRLAGRLRGHELSVDRRLEEILAFA